MFNQFPEIDPPVGYIIKYCFFPVTSEFNIADFHFQTKIGSDLPGPDKDWFFITSRFLEYDQIVVGSFSVNGVQRIPRWVFDLSAELFLSKITCKGDFPY